MQGMISYNRKVKLMNSVLRGKNISDKTAPSFREAYYSAIDLVHSHNFQIRTQLALRLRSQSLDVLLKSSRSGQESEALFKSLGLGISNLDAGETPLTWAHVLYLSLDE